MKVGVEVREVQGEVQGCPMLLLELVELGISKSASQ